MLVIGAVKMTPALTRLPIFWMALREGFLSRPKYTIIF